MEEVYYDQVLLLTLTMKSVNSNFIFFQKLKNKTITNTDPFGIFIFVGNDLPLKKEIL